MMKTHPLVPIMCGLAFGLTGGQPAIAASVAIQHSASVKFDSDAFSAPVEDSQTETAVDDDPERVQVGIGGFSFYNGSVDIRPNGAFVAEGFLFGQGRLDVEVNIDAQVMLGPTESLIFDPFVIVDGGFLDTLTSADAELGFVWEVTARVFDENGVQQLGQFQEQQASARILYGSTLGPPTVTTDPTNRLDMELNFFEDSLAIPFTVQRFDAPLSLQPNWMLDLEYDVRIAALVDDDTGFTEGINFRFQDPLVPDTSGPALNLGQVGPGPAVVRLPASLPLLLSGLAGLAFMRRRSARS